MFAASTVIGDGGLLALGSLAFWQFSACSQLSSNLECDAFGILMLPEAKYEPAAFAQYLISSAVSGDIRLKLLAPPRCIRARHGPMNRASVPVASVNEHRHAVLPPRYIATHPQVRFKANVDAIPKPRRV